MDDDYMAELKQWRENVDGFIADSGLHRRATAIRMDSMEKSLEQNTAMTTEMHTGLAEAIPVILDLKGAARTFKRVGEFVKPIGVGVAMVLAVVAYFKTGEWKWPL